MAFYIDTTIKEYDALVLSDYYDSPISHLAAIERKLKEAGVTKGVVLLRRFADCETHPRQPSRRTLPRRR